MSDALLTFGGDAQTRAALVELLQQDYFDDPNAQRGLLSGFGRFDSVAVDGLVAAAACLPEGHKRLAALVSKIPLSMPVAELRFDDTTKVGTRSIGTIRKSHKDAAGLAGLALVLSGILLLGTVGFLFFHISSLSSSNSPSVLDVVALIGAICVAIGLIFILSAVDALRRRNRKSYFVDEEYLWVLWVQEIEKMTPEPELLKSGAKGAGSM